MCSSVLNINSKKIHFLKLFIDNGLSFKNIKNKRFNLNKYFLKNKGLILKLIYNFKLCFFIFLRLSFIKINSLKLSLIIKLFKILDKIKFLFIFKKISNKKSLNSKIFLNTNRKDWEIKSEKVNLIPKINFSDLISDPKKIWIIKQKRKFFGLDTDFYGNKKLKKKSFNFQKFDVKKRYFKLNPNLKISLYNQRLYNNLKIKSLGERFLLKKNNNYKSKIDYYNVSFRKRLFELKDVKSNNLLNYNIIYKNKIYHSFFKNSYFNYLKKVNRLRYFDKKQNINLNKSFNIYNVNRFRFLYSLNSSKLSDLQRVRKLKYNLSNMLVSDNVNKNNTHKKKFFFFKSSNNLDNLFSRITENTLHSKKYFIINFSIYLLIKYLIKYFGLKIYTKIFKFIKNYFYSLFNNDLSCYYFYINNLNKVFGYNSKKNFYGKKLRFKILRSKRNLFSRRFNRLRHRYWKRRYILRKLKWHNLKRLFKCNKRLLKKFILKTRVVKYKPLIFGINKFIFDNNVYIWKYIRVKKSTIWKRNILKHFTTRFFFFTRCFYLSFYWLIYFFSFFFLYCQRILFSYG